MDCFAGQVGQVREDFTPGGDPCPVSCHRDPQPEKRAFFLHLGAAVHVASLQHGATQKEAGLQETWATLSRLRSISSAAGYVPADARLALRLLPSKACWPGSGRHVATSTNCSSTLHFHACSRTCRTGCYSLRPRADVDRSTPQLSSHGVQQYWTASKVPPRSRARNLKSFAADATQSDATLVRRAVAVCPRSAGRDSTGEVLTRVWTAVLCLYDRQRGGKEFEIVGPQHHDRTPGSATSRVDAAGPRTGR